MPSIRNPRALLVILAAFWLPALHASTPETAAASVEFPVWSHSFVGALGSKQVEVFLNRVADNLSGSYCYQPCSNQTRIQLVLEGQVQGTGAELSERDRKNKAATTGIWQIESLKDGITGTWVSPDGKRRLPLALRRAESEDEVLLQSLETESRGTCSIFTPVLFDANFDGWPDLSIAQFLPAGPNIPHQTWLYDPEAGRFVDAPATLQGITSPDFDPEHQIVYSFWRASCCEHGVSIYRWKGAELHEVDTRSSYLLPVMEGDTRRLCYITPGYAEGFIEYPGRVEQSADGRLRLHQIDPKTCEIDDWAFLERTYIDIWKPAKPGEKPVLLRSENIVWKSTETSAGQRYCPEVPYFDSGRIQRTVLSDDPDLCRADDPARG
ncbi:MAG: nitrite reductase [Gammaproteobacteria bacterium HGW-Gammaproteobacteria-12]|nr:MAG: nitrite reductase [Gammaproteobacteria bacterium HGW-Gammaproteobacteria-12]